MDAEAAAAWRAADAADPWISVRWSDRLWRKSEAEALEAANAEKLAKYDAEIAARSPDWTGSR